MKALYYLFAGKRFEFYSSYDLEDTIYQLNKHSKRYKRKSISWKKTYQLLFIEVDENNKSIVHFRGDKEVIKNLFIVFSGEISRKPNSIIIKGISKPSILTLILPMFFLIGWYSLFTSPSYGLISKGFLILGVFTVIAIYISIIQSQNKMIQILHSILNQPNNKKNT